MEDIPELIKNLGVIATAIATILGTILAIIKIFHEFTEKVIKPLWLKKMKPVLKLVLASGTLVIPIGLILWCQVYWIAGHIDPRVIKHPVVFAELIILPTAGISFISYIWCVLLYPKLKIWVKTKANPLSVTENNQDQDTQLHENPVNEPNGSSRVIE